MTSLQEKLEAVRARRKKINLKAKLKARLARRKKPVDIGEVIIEPVKSCPGGCGPFTGTGFDARGWQRICCSGCGRFYGYKPPPEVIEAKKQSKRSLGSDI